MRRDRSELNRSLVDRGVAPPAAAPHYTAAHHYGEPQVEVGIGLQRIV